MKVVLLTLSGDASQAYEKLGRAYPDALIEPISRSEFETGSLANRLHRLRALQPNIFAIVTESLSWQRGRDMFMMFGAFAGAREVLMLDSNGNLIKKSRTRLLATAPAKVTTEAVKTAAILTRAKQELRVLEQQVNFGSIQKRTTPAIAKSASTVRKVCYLRSTPGPGTQAGGAASHIKGVVEGMVQLGANVHVISNDQIAGFNPDIAPLTVLESEAIGATRAVFDIHNNELFTESAVPLIQIDAPDFIYQRYARFSWAGVVGSLQTNRPLFLEYNGSEVWVGRHWDRVGRLDLLERYERLNLAAATRIFVVSDVERNNLEALGVPTEKIIVNANGVDTDKFCPGIGGDKERRKLDFHARDVVVGFVGTFGPWHGVLVLAQAIKAIPMDASIRVLVVGSGSLQAEMEQALQAEVKTGTVVFTGPVLHDRVPALLDACDILVAPHIPLAEGNEFFGSPTKLFEYMSMGKAIVASRLGQIGDVIEDEVTGLLVEPGNVSHLSKAILRLASTPELRHRLGENARRRAIEKHTWKQNAQRVLDSYAEGVR